MGERFGPYELHRLLGRGAMGEVWHAFDTRRERDVALKRLGASVATDPDAQARFRREARMTARLSSVHVIPIHDFGEIDGRLFVDMRLVNGGDLATLRTSHPRGLPTERAVDIVTQLADALGDAHAAGLVHRDVKPSNVLLTEHRGADFCYLVDFGIARLAVAGAGAGEPLTSTGTVLGTTAYMAPELFSGEVATVRSDVYALACLFHEILTGARPYPGPDPVTHMAQHVNAAIPLPSAGRPELAALDEVVAAGMAKDPAHRFDGARALADAAAAALPAAGTVPVRASPPPAPPRAEPAPPPAPSPSASSSRSPAPPAPAALPPPSLASSARRPVGRRAVVVVLVALLALAIVAGSVVAVNTLYDRYGGGGVTAPTALPVAGAPTGSRGIALSAGGDRAYLTGSVAAGPGAEPVPAITVLETATGTVLRTIALDTVPGDVALSPDGRRVHVSERGTDDAPGSALATYDADTGADLGRVETGAAPAGVAPTPDGRLVYVAVGGTPAAPDSTVAVVDTASGTVVATVAVGPRPGAVAVTADGTRVVAVGEGGTVSLIDTATNAVTATPPVGPSARDVAAGSDGSLVTVSHAGTAPGADGAVSVLDAATGTVTGTLPAGVADPVALGVTPDGATAVVAGAGVAGASGATVAVVDTGSGSVRGTVTVGPAPAAIAVTADGVRAYVTTRVQTWVVDLPS